MQVGRDTGTGTESERIKLHLTIEVEGVDFDSDGEQQSIAREHAGMHHCCQELSS